MRRLCDVRDNPVVLTKPTVLREAVGCSEIFCFVIIEIIISGVAGF